ncbi:hypothetical protein [Barnesiella intestinihominis]|uniref:hypothetical protein n=1 Tax=Bacteroidales TaxID=171549 RepID=UPI003AAF8887
MRVLVACEESQAVTIEMRKLGHEAYSCDIQACSGGHPEWHLQCDALELLKMKWDMIIAFPPCTHLCVKGLPLLRPTQIIPKEKRTNEIWKSQFNGKSISWSSEECKKLRSKTFPGIARAMAEQWAGKITE